MSQTTPTPQPGAPQAGTPATAPLVVNIQYVKDLSFEVPGAPQIFTTLRAQPQVAINLDVQARRIAEGGSAYEVTLMIRAEATDPSTPANGQTPAPVVFVAELTYAGVFTLTGLPDNAIEPVLLVECPRMLFPSPAISWRMCRAMAVSRQCCCNRSISCSYGRAGGHRQPRGRRRFRCDGRLTAERPGRAGPFFSPRRLSRGPGSGGSLAWLVSVADTARIHHRGPEDQRTRGITP